MNPCTICNGESDKSDLFGTVEIRRSSNEEMNNKIKKAIHSCAPERLSVPVLLDYTNPFCMIIETSTDESKKASQIAQSITVLYIKNTEYSYAELEKLVHIAENGVKNGRSYAEGHG